MISSADNADIVMQ